MAEDDEDKKDEAELEGGRMPFLKHLVELRDRLRNAALAFVAAFLVCWYFAGQIYEWLQTPLFNIWNTHCNINMQELWKKAFGSTLPQSLSDVYNRYGVGDAWTCTAHGLSHELSYGAPKLNYFGLTQPFWVDMSIGLWAGIFVASPIIFYQLWKFIAPGLYKKERRTAVAFAAFSAVFFVCGALFCFYFTLPPLFR